jgi:hypothetical protein
MVTQLGTGCEAQQSQPVTNTAKQKKQLHKTTDLIALSQSCRDMSWVIDMPRRQPQQKQPQTTITDTSMQDAAAASDAANQEQANQKPLKPSTTGAWGLLGLISHASVAASPNNLTSKQTSQPVKAKVNPCSNELDKAELPNKPAELDVEKGSSQQMECQPPIEGNQGSGTANAAATNSAAVAYSSWANLWAWAPCWSYTPLSSSPSSKAATTGQSSSKSSSVASSCQENDTSMLDDDETTSGLGRQGNLSVHAVQQAQVAVQ